MYWIYRISSSYDGFTPSEIPNRINDDRFITYNWAQYFDQIERNDVVFTYFRGRGVKSGIYLISRITKVNPDRSVIGKIINTQTDKPLIPAKDYVRERNLIFNRPRGSVFVIPPRAEPFFQNILTGEVTSEIEIFDTVNCADCKMEGEYRHCTIFGVENMINWKKEVAFNKPFFTGILSPFWILPKQSWWMKESWGSHPLSRFFYALKSGYKDYAKLFAEGLVISIERDDRFNDVNFDYIINIPLSPDKIKLKEYDRVDDITQIISNELNINYDKNILYLKKPISRRNYKMQGMNDKFSAHYYDFLTWKSETDYNGKNILIIDDVITDGNTITTFGKKIKDEFPDSSIYAATCGIMAKMRNMKYETRKKYRR